MSYDNNLPENFQDLNDDDYHDRQRYLNEREDYGSECCGAEVKNFQSDDNLGICRDCGEHCGKAYEDEDEFWERVAEEDEQRETERKEAYWEAIANEQELGY